MIKPLSPACAWGLLPWSVRWLGEVPDTTALPLQLLCAHLGAVHVRFGLHCRVDACVHLCRRRRLQVSGGGGT